MIAYPERLAADGQGEAVPGLLALVRATADVLVITVLVIYVGRRGSPFEVGMVTVSYSLAMTLFSPVWGAIADVTGRRYTVLLASCILSSFAILLFVFAGSVWLFILGSGVYKLFAAAYSPLVIAIVSDRSSLTDRGGSVGVINSARAAGATLGRIGSGALVAVLTPMYVFISIAGVSFLGAVIASFIDDPDSGSTAGFSRRKITKEIRSRLVPDTNGVVLRRAGLRWLYLSVAVQGMAVVGIMSLMPVYLIQEVGTSELTMGLLLGISPALQVVFMYIMGRYTDDVGRKPLIVVGTFGRGVLFPLVAAAATSFALLEVRILVVAIGFIVLSTTFSAMFSGTVAFIGDVTPPERSSEFMGLLWTALGTGGVFGPLLVGTIATYTSYEVSFVVAAGLTLAATLIVAVGLDSVYEPAVAEG